MPSWRETSGSRMAKVMGTVRRTLTGLPPTLVTSYSHWRAASTAASSSPGTLRITLTVSTLPSGSTTSSRMTMPRMPWAWASGGYVGGTVLLRLGTGTPSLPACRGASFVSWPRAVAASADAGGEGDGGTPGASCLPCYSGSLTSPRSARAAAMIFSCRWPGTSS